ncbi:hypothetical protein D3C76_1484040 [compost metagenome]
MSARPSQISPSTSRSRAVSSVNDTLGTWALMLFTLANFSIRVRLNQDASFITSSIAATSSSSERLRSVMFISTSR